MNNGTKILASIVAFVAGVTLVSGASKTTDIAQKFILNFLPPSPSSFNISNGFINFNLPIQVNNQSAFDVSATYLYVSIQYKDSSGAWQNLFIQNNPVKELVLKARTNSNLPNIPLSCQLLNVPTILQLLNGKLSGTLNVVVRFTVLGLEQKLETTVDANSMFAPLRNLLKNFGLGEVRLGYASNSFHHRQIKDGREFDALMPKASLVENTIRLSGNPKSTIEDMHEIVLSTLGQTKKLSKSLAGSSIKETALNTYNFLHDNIQYKKDEEDREQIREPQRAWADRKTGIDCDCFATFCSSILANLGVKHAIKMCSNRPDGEFVHVYVVVLKDSTKPNEVSSYKSRENYYTIDACLHNFDEEAKGITNEFLKPVTMRTTRLSGIDGNQYTTLPIRGLEGLFGDAPVTYQTISDANKKLLAPLTPADRKIPVTNVTMGKKLRPFTPDEVNKVHLVVIEPMRKMLNDTLAKSKTNPELYSPVYNVPKFQEAIQKVLANWGDARLRTAALKEASANNLNLLNKDGLLARKISAKQEGLSGAYMDPLTHAYPLYKYNASIGGVQLHGLGDVFDWVGDQVKAASDWVGDAVRSGYDGVKNATDWAFDKINKAGDAIGDAAKWVVANIQKYNPIMIIGRTAYRGLIAINFRNWAGDFQTQIANGGEDQIRKTWESDLVGGDYGDLKAAINAGHGKGKAFNESDVIVQAKDDVSASDTTSFNTFRRTQLEKEYDENNYAPTGTYDQKQADFYRWDWVDKMLKNPNQNKFWGSYGQRPGKNGIPSAKAKASPVKPVNPPSILKPSPSVAKEQIKTPIATVVQQPVKQAVTAPIAAKPVVNSYQVQQDITNGYIPNTGKTNVLFKKGDVVSGSPTTSYIFNKTQSGIFAKPTVSTAHVETANGLVFIPMEVLKLNTPTPVTNSQAINKAIQNLAVLPKAKVGGLGALNGEPVTVASAVTTASPIIGLMSTAFGVYAKITGDKDAEKASKDLNDIKSTIDSGSKIISDGSQAYNDFKNGNMPNFDTSKINTNDLIKNGADYIKQGTDLIGKGADTYNNVKAKADEILKTLPDTAVITKLPIDAKTGSNNTNNGDAKGGSSTLLYVLGGAGVLGLAALAMRSKSESNLDGIKKKRIKEFTI